MIKPRIRITRYREYFVFNVINNAYVTGCWPTCETDRYFPNMPGRFGYEGFLKGNILLIQKKQ